MRRRSQLVPAQLGLALSLALVLTAFRVAWQVEAPPPLPAAPPVEPDIVMDVLPTAYPTAPPPVPASALPPVEVPDDEAAEADVAEAVPLPPDPTVLDRPPLPPPLPTPRGRDTLEDEPEEPFLEIAEVMPALVGGIAGLQERIAYPEFARRAGVEGRVFVRFIVNTDGTASDVEVVRGIGGGCDEAAVAAVRESRFTPGLQRGRPVRVRMALPVTFRLR